MTGTKGKTTTSSLTAAILAADERHPVVLGGNIGLPIVERLLELTPDHRVVDELSELQLPTLSRGTTVAVYTNVTSDHLDRHGSLEGYRRVKRRLAELVDPDGALVLNVEDPIVASYAAVGRARVDPVPPRRAAARRARASSTAGSWPTGVERLALAGGGGPATSAAGGSCRPPSWPSRARTTCRTRWRRSRWRSPSGSNRPRSGRRRPPSAAWSTGSSRSRWSTACASSTTRRGPSPTR